MVKEFDSCVILTDTLKERKVDDASIAYLKEEITTEEYLDKMDEENQEDEESKPDERKFYQIETKITFMNGENEDERVQTFVVNTFNVDRAMMLITHYLKNKEEECEKQAKEKGTWVQKEGNTYSHWISQTYPGRAVYSERVFNGLYGITLLTCLPGLWR